ncbi:MAG: acyl-CoA synthetase [Geminicoccaceae bacterium]
MAGDAGSIFDLALPRVAANHRALTPLDFLDWSAGVFPDRVGVVYGDQRLTWRQVDARCRRLASGLRGLGVGPGDTVAVMCPNIPPMLEAHYGIPMAGAVLNALNTRLDAATIAFILGHGEAKVLLADTEYAPVVKAAMTMLGREITVVDIVDAVAPGERLSELDYEALLAQGDPGFAWQPPAGEWDAISLCYTSGTTGNPKGVVYHHRGAFLNALGNALMLRLDDGTRYLWTVPMFHCNGWTHSWAVTAVGGTHVCLRKVDPALIFALLAEAGVTHLGGAPIVLNLLIHAPEAVKRPLPRPVQVVTGGAAPPSAVIAAMERMGFRLTHMYGLTESYGPATLCIGQPGWPELPQAERARLMARQGVHLPTLGACMVADPDTMLPVEPDGRTLGEIMLRGNTIMKGYLKNPSATEAAFQGGWYHSGDLAVMHPDGYVEVKDRAKDIIISGGENISSLEVEDALYRHPAVLEAAVIAMPDAHWGERPCAFVALKEGAEADEAELIAWCRQHLAHFKAPARVIFGPLPKTSTGKIQKFELRQRVGQP